MNKKLASYLLTFFLTVVVCVSLFSLPFAAAETVEQESNVDLGLLLTYKDGSSGTYSVLPRPLDIFTPSGTYVADIRVVLSATPIFSVDTGVTLTAWSITGKASGYIKTTGGTILATVFSNSDFSATGTTLTSGSATALSSTISSGTLQSLYNGWVDGSNYNYVWVLNSFTMTLTLSNGMQLQKSASATDLVWTFRYTSGWTPPQATPTPPPPTVAPTLPPSTPPPATPTPTPPPTITYDAYGVQNPPGEYHYNPYYNPNNMFYMDPGHDPDNPGEPWSPNPFYGCYYSVFGEVQPVALSNSETQPSIVNVVGVVVVAVAAVAAVIVVMRHRKHF